MYKPLNDSIKGKEDMYADMLTRVYRQALRHE